MLLGIYNFIATVLHALIGKQEPPSDGIPKVRSVWNE